MAGIISALSWVINNWQLISTAFSSLASITLFFMHGNNKAELQALRDFITSVHVRQDPSPDSAKAVSEAQFPKI